MYVHPLTVCNRATKAKKQTTDVTSYRSDPHTEQLHADLYMYRYTTRVSADQLLVQRRPTHADSLRPISETHYHAASRRCVMCAMRSPEHRLLKEQRAHVNARDEWGRTPLWYAAQHHFNRIPRIVRTLLENGADPNLADAEGLTPLHVICRRKLDDGSMDVFLQICDYTHRFTKIYFNAKVADENVPKKRTKNPVKTLTRETGQRIEQRHAVQQQQQQQQLVVVTYIVVCLKPLPTVGAESISTCVSSACPAAENVCVWKREVRMSRCPRRIAAAAVLYTYFRVLLSHRRRRRAVVLFAVIATDENSKSLIRKSRKQTFKSTFSGENRPVRTTTTTTTALKLANVGACLVLYLFLPSYDAAAAADSSSLKPLISKYVFDFLALLLPALRAQSHIIISYTECVLLPYDHGNGVVPPCARLESSFLRHTLIHALCSVFFVGTLCGYSISSRHRHLYNLKKVCVAVISEGVSYTAKTTTTTTRPRSESESACYAASGTHYRKLSLARVELVKGRERRRRRKWLVGGKEHTRTAYYTAAATASSAHVEVKSSLSADGQSIVSIMNTFFNDVDEKTINTLIHSNKPNKTCNYGLAKDNIRDKDYDEIKLNHLIKEQNEKVDNAIHDQHHNNRGHEATVAASNNHHKQQQSAAANSKSTSKPLSDNKDSFSSGSPRVLSLRNKTTAADVFQYYRYLSTMIKDEVKEEDEQRRKINNRRCSAPSLVRMIPKSDDGQRALNLKANISHVSLINKPNNSMSVISLGSSSAFNSSFSGMKISQNTIKKIFNEIDQEGTVNNHKERQASSSITLTVPTTTTTRRACLFLIEQLVQAGKDELERRLISALCVPLNLECKAPMQLLLSLLQLMSYQYMKKQLWQQFMLTSSIDGISYTEATMFTVGAPSSRVYNDYKSNNEPLNTSFKISGDNASYRRITIDNDDYLMQLKEIKMQLSKSMLIVKINTEYDNNKDYDKDYSKDSDKSDEFKEKAVDYDDNNKLCRRFDEKTMIVRQPANNDIPNTCEPTMTLNCQSTTVIKSQAMFDVPAIQSTLENEPLNKCRLHRNQTTYPLVTPPIQILNGDNKPSSRAIRLPTSNLKIITVRVLHLSSNNHRINSSRNKLSLCSLSNKPESTTTSRCRIPWRSVPDLLPLPIRQPSNNLNN
ncbi:unnamed protein product [Trichogramma brassicae]|uniref:Uncharacterized protein n=1 Tax=Trichogramma brassicae TaxID=86971 RepID=A0A6H5IK22_9HYME|nr:unnamed protein product [Trichogramma brassicae]